MTKKNASLIGPLNKEKLNEKIVALIKKLIFSNQLKVGDKLPSEREMMEETGVSRSVVREAFRSLEQSGLVEIRQGGTGGAFVVCNLEKPIFNSAFDLYNQGKLTFVDFAETRKAIESVAVRAAAHKATPEDIARLHELNEASRSDVKEMRNPRQHAASFHTALAEISGNHLSRYLVSGLFDLLAQIRPDSSQTKKFKQETYLLHKKIIDALEAKDADLAEKLIAEDVERVGTFKPHRVRSAAADAV